MTEIERLVLGRQGLHEGIGAIETLRQRVDARQEKRNAQQVKINGRFTAEVAVPCH